MSNRTSWTAGNGQGLTWGAAFNSSDLASLASGHSVMSSVADIANQTNLDMFADVAIELAIASTTLTAGAVASLYIFDKFGIDGSNSYYGDNSLPSGTQEAYLPNYGLAGVCAPTITGAAQTVVTLLFKQIIIPPRAFRFAFANSLGVTLGSGTQYASYVTYNLNLND
ncbi:MAG: hypothetical protein WAN43_16055 [Rhodomicrobium sp.]